MNDNCYQVPTVVDTRTPEPGEPDFDWPNRLLNELDPSLADGVPSFGQ